MKRALTVIGIVTLLLGLSFAAAPYWLGIQTESAFNDAVKGMAARSGLLSKNFSFSRGWMSSEARNEFLLPTTPLVISATHRIEHGPLPLSQLLSGEIAPALALIKTTLRFSPSADAPASLSETLKSLPPLRLETVLDLSGNGTSNLKIAAAIRKQDKTTIHWAAGGGQMNFDRAWKKINMDFSFPLISVSSARGKLAIKNVRLTSDMYEGTAGYMFGRTNLSIASIAMKPLVDVQNMKLSAVVQPKGRFATININFGIKALQIAKDRYGPGELSVAVRNLDTITLKQFENDLNKIYIRALPREQMQMMIAGKTLELAGKLSQNNPVVEITRLSFTAPGGELTGKAMFVIQGKEQDLSANPMLLLTAIKGSAELSMPESLAKAVVMPQIQRDIRNLGREGKLNASEAARLTPETLNQIAEEVYPKYLQESGFNRWFIKQKNIYQFSMSINRGQIVINGVPLSPTQ